MKTNSISNRSIKTDWYKHISKFRQIFRMIPYLWNCEFCFKCWNNISILEIDFLPNSQKYLHFWEFFYAAGVLQSENLVGKYIIKNSGCLYNRFFLKPYIFNSCQIRLQNVQLSNNNIIEIYAESSLINDLDYQTTLLVNNHFNQCYC